MPQCCVPPAQVPRRRRRRDQALNARSAQTALVQMAASIICDRATMRSAHDALRRGREATQEMHASVRSVAHPFTLSRISFHHLGLRQPQARGGRRQALGRQALGRQARGRLPFACSGRSSIPPSWKPSAKRSGARSTCAYMMRARGAMSGCSSALRRCSGCISSSLPLRLRGTLARSSRPRRRRRTRASGGRRGSSRPWAQSCGAPPTTRARTSHATCAQLEG